MVETVFESMLCPICNEFLPAFARGLFFHAKKHQITPETLYNALFPNNKTCGCGCGTKTKWKGWKIGYALFLRGHEAKTVQGKEKRSETLKKAYESHELVHWTKCIDKKLVSLTMKSAGHKTSQKLRDGYANGNYTHWMKDGVHKLEYDRWKEIIIDSIEKRNRSKLMSSDDIITRIMSSIGDRFTIISGLERDLLECRKNNVSHIVTLKCTNCELNNIKSIYGIIRTNELRCQACDHDNHYSSIAEQSIVEFVKSLGFIVMQNDRTTVTGIEIDAFIPAKRMAIEFNGLYWHSEFVQKQRHYHERKRMRCLDNEISLFNIFEDEWRDKRNIIESMIMHRLGVSKHIIDAQKCDIIESKTNDAKKFFTDNHIDGNARFSHVICLTLNDEIIAAMSLRKPLHKKWNDALEITKFCTKINTHVPGALSILTKCAISYAKSCKFRRLMTCIDTRFGENASSYVTSGWHDCEEIGERFWWTDKVNRFDAFKFHTSIKKSVKGINIAKIWGTKQLRLFKSV